MALQFEWDEDKSRGNLKKHRVAFEEAKTVFNDPFAITIVDPVHSDEEGRYLGVGQSAKGRMLMVYYTERKDNIRIIGCRKATKSERRTYEDQEIPFR
jgi:uncharacterized DUF497 family protein